MTESAAPARRPAVVAGVIIGVVLAVVFAYLFAMLASVSFGAAGVIAALILMAGWAVFCALAYGPDTGGGSDGATDAAH